MRHGTLDRRTAAPSDEVVARVVRGGVLGGLPGLLLIGVPALLAALDLITADQSQIGFLGLPLMVAGILAGTALAAGRDHSAAAVAGVGAGLILGIIVGGVLAANAVLPGLWVVLVPVAMIAGGAVGASRAGRHDRR